MTKPFTGLKISGLELSIHLGWPNKERDKLQTILLDIEITFPEPPLACQTDILEDTICYATLIEQLKAHLETKHFRLIEHLSATVYAFLKTKISNDRQLSVNIIKHPKIPELKGQVSFHYADGAT